MNLKRIIPVLLIENKGLVKTIRFDKRSYVGDPINAVKIFNDKEVDELILLDISANPEGRNPDIAMIRDIAGECFMPLCYGGGIKSLENIRQVLFVGVEKVCMNTAAIENPSFVESAAAQFGSSTIVVSVDAKKNLMGKYQVCSYGGRKKTNIELLAYVKEMEKRGAGEIMINSIDQDGAMNGYDLKMIRQVCDAVNIPVIACGGAKEISDFKCAIENGASAAAAGSMFVFNGKHRAVLISYPSPEELKSIRFGA
jgi:imidazole glycerol-phosphate synthase subunit HisF